MKDCFLASAEILFAEFDNKDAIIKQIKGLQLSDSTIMRRIENIGKDVSDQLCAYVSAAPCFSIAVDESTDLTDVAQLCVWVRLLPLVGQTRGEDILNAFLAFFDEKKTQLVRSSKCVHGWRP